ncbi:MAG: amidohydrolase family protein [Cytophagales bacterium]|nr:amidohydrolase family protein [Cytophagales bacterium]
MTIDSHQHFWKYNPVRDAWITGDMKVLQQDFLPPDLEPLLTAHSVEGCVAVQADSSEHETIFLSELAQADPRIKGVVGWTDLLSEDLESALEKYRDLAVVKGFRHILQAEKEGFMLQPKFIKGVKLLEQYGFTYDILIYEKQLDEALDLVKQVPDRIPLVIDHIAKPNIKESSFSYWQEKIKLIATHPNVFIKLSGMVTEADWHHWEKKDFVPYIETVLNAFGPTRIMFGSDWPVCLLAASYERVISMARDFTATLSVEEQAAIMGGTAAQFYSLS